MLFTARAIYLAGVLNSTVHIVMYCYYLASAVLSKSTVSKLTPVKQCITILQMTQFAIILLYLAVHRLWYKCHYNDPFLAVFAAAVAVMFYTFYDFYKRAYTVKGQKLKSYKK